MAMHDNAKLGPYRLIRLLGAGGMAEVWLAEVYGASGFEKRVALKVLLPELRGDGTFERLLIDEARLGARLNHANLVGVHDLGVANGTYYMRMDLVDGADMRTLLERGPVPRALALWIAEEVAVALHYLHGFCGEDRRPLGLVHRDVNPANVLVSRAGEVKLADYGIAKATVMRNITQGGVRKGKHAYMSPEQVAGTAVTPRSDVFSLGITLAEMLTGVRPFDGNSPVETMERIRHARDPDLRDVASADRDLLLRCLAQEPGERFATAEELRSALVRLRGGDSCANSIELGRWVEGASRNGCSVNGTP